MKTLKHTVIIALAIAGLRTHASATLITYSYIGNDFTFGTGQPGFTTNDNITASFTVNGPLAPSMTFDLISIGATMTMISNGPFTIPLGFGDTVTTDASGNIVEWSLADGANLPDGSLLHLETLNGTFVDDLAVVNLLDGTAYLAFVNDDPGIWSSGPATVPDQASTLALLCVCRAKVWPSVVLIIFQSLV